MSEYLIQGETLDDIADAINAKTGGSSAMTPAQMVTAIESISGGGGGAVEVTITSDLANTSTLPDIISAATGFSAWSATRKNGVYVQGQALLLHAAYGKIQVPGKSTKVNIGSGSAVLYIGGSSGAVSSSYWGVNGIGVLAGSVFEVLEVTDIVQDYN